MNVSTMIGAPKAGEGFSWVVRTRARVVAIGWCDSLESAKTVTDTIARGYATAPNKKRVNALLDALHKGIA